MNKSIFPLSLAIILAMPAASAHHSSAMFKMDTRISLSGTVREFQWTNPHSYIQLLVKDENGIETEWSLELGAVNYLYNQGWRPSTVKAGQMINVTIAPLSNGHKGGLAIEVTTTDGRKLGGSKQ
jgi:Family of unknown function (DUF6152)